MEESNGHDEPVEEFGEGVIDEIKKDEEVRECGSGMLNSQFDAYVNFNFHTFICSLQEETAANGESQAEQPAVDEEEIEE